MGKCFVIVLIAVVVTCGVAGGTSASPVYSFVGSWIVGDGPVWTSNPPVYSGQDAAAFLFGGNASDYVTSTIDNTVPNINFRTFLDGWGNTTFLVSPAPDTYSLSSNGGGYNQFPSFSAYVLDHTCSNRYSNPGQGCQGFGTQYVNYAFRDINAAVPEPMTMILGGTGLLALGYVGRKRLLRSGS
jgi:hypothetical protein